MLSWLLQTNRFICIKLHWAIWARQNLLLHYFKSYRAFNSIDLKLTVSTLFSIRSNRQMTKTTQCFDLNIKLAIISTKSYTNSFSNLSDICSGWSVTVTLTNNAETHSLSVYLTHAIRFVKSLHLLDKNQPNT